MVRKKKEEVIVEEVVETTTETTQGNVSRMNMHRLLRRLKTYDVRIKDLLNDGTFVATLTTKYVNYNDAEGVEEKIKANYQKLQALINNKAILEQAKIMSNSKTMCEIGGKTYTVAEAIKRKENLAMEKQVLKALRSQRAAAVVNYNNEIDRMNTAVESKVRTIFGENPTDTEAVETYIKNYGDKNAPKFIDPLNLETLIDELAKSINDFEVEVDAVLNESNAITIVEVVLDGNE